MGCHCRCCHPLFFRHMPATGWKFTTRLIGPRGAFFAFMERIALPPSRSSIASPLPPSIFWLSSPLTVRGNQTQVRGQLSRPGVRPSHKLVLYPVELQARHSRIVFDNSRLGSF